MGFLDSVRGALRGAVVARAPRVGPPDPVPGPDVDPGTAPELYTIRVGDTLAEIATRLGVPAGEVVRLNDLDNPDLLFPGQVLRIPSRT